MLFKGGGSTELPPHPVTPTGASEVNTHLDEGDSDHNQHGLRSKRRGVITAAQHRSPGNEGRSLSFKIYFFLFAK